MRIPNEIKEIETMEVQQTTNSRRKVLNHVVCNILVESGFDVCEKQALETLTEMLQSCKFFTTNYCHVIVFVVI